MLQLGHFHLTHTPTFNLKLIVSVKVSSLCRIYSERPRGHFESYNPRPGYLVCKYKTISNIRNLVFLFPLIVSRFTPLLKPKQSKMIDIITWLNNIKKVATPNLQIK